MEIKKVIKMIKRRKKLINFLLLFLSPTNKFMVNLSQNLDKHIAIYQSYLSFRHCTKAKYQPFERMIA